MQRHFSFWLRVAFMAWPALALVWSGLAVAAQAGAGASCPPQAQAPTRSLIQRAREQATDRGFLWRIARGGRDSYLYGTVHAGRPEWFAMGPQTAASLARTGVLALEINVTDPAVQEALREAAQGTSRPLPSALMQALRDAWTAECLPVAELARGAPEVHALQLAVAQAQRQGLFPHYGAESVLLMNSLAVQRPVAGLEAVQTQLSALLARDEEEAAVLVGEALAEWRRPEGAHTMERLVRAWAAGDLEELARYPDWCGCMDSPRERDYYIRLVDGRNPGMADAIERLHAQVSVFAAVGALHMVGPQGLPALLRARGFTVSRVF